jgi:hypothetical protein
MKDTGSKPAPQQMPPFPAGKAFAVVLGVGVVGIGVAMGVVYAMGRPEQTLPAALTGAGCVLGSLAALEAVRRAAPKGAERLVIATLAGFALRLVGAAAGAVAAMGIFQASKLSTGLWLAGWYLIFLLIDVAILRGFYKMLDPAHPGNGPTPSSATGGNSSADSEMQP